MPVPSKPAVDAATSAYYLLAMQDPIATITFELAIKVPRHLPCQSLL
jgi:hypothetical protein